jgi:acetyltransferase-like isoleucine patch superfamily enzyme
MTMSGWDMVVIVFSAVRNWIGAIVGECSVVTRSVPDNAIAPGAPAKVVKMRMEI